MWLLFAVGFWKALVCLALATEDDTGVVQRPKLLEESHAILSLQRSLALGTLLSMDWSMTLKSLHTGD